MQLVQFPRRKRIKKLLEYLLFQTRGFFTLTEGLRDEKIFDNTNIAYSNFNENSYASFKIIVPLIHENGNKEIKISILDGEVIEVWLFDHISQERITIEKIICLGKIDDESLQVTKINEVTLMIYFKIL